jgi:hypothetical protein
LNGAPPRKSPSGSESQSTSPTQSTSLVVEEAGECGRPTGAEEERFMRES